MYCAISVPYSKCCKLIAINYVCADCYLIVLFSAFCLDYRTPHVIERRRGKCSVVLKYYRYQGEKLSCYDRKISSTWVAVFTTPDLPPPNKNSDHSGEYTLPWP